MTHWLCCTFYYISFRVAHADHYAAAPWRPSGTAIEQLGERGSLYLRSLYWALMTVTTTGHVDIIETDGDTWEVRRRVHVHVP